jgi:hypothetical protein
MSVVNRKKGNRVCYSLRDHRGPIEVPDTPRRCFCLDWTDTTLEKIRAERPADR